MKKQLSYAKRLLLLSGVAVIMCSSCIFIPKDEELETITTETEETEDGEIILKKDGLTCVWQDEFDYSGVPDTSKWKYQTGKSGWGNNELQNYIDNTSEAKTAIVKDGVLTIKAYKEDGEWKSARLNSKSSWKYGLIEARMKVTDRPGAWPAFWMMPQNNVYGKWPNSGEIDIMENAPATCGNHRIFSTLHAAGHYGGSGQGIGGKTYDSNLSSEWHTLGIKWTEDKITAYYDDVAVGSYSNNGSGSEDWPYDQDFYIILNLAIGGNLGGDDYVDSLNGEAEFLIDYVRVYQ
ncbi:MAG: glycoside hydrolase family 16 protein [Treponema sp.]|nr:glycoside hydrolase family 16 protein [Treponema sp.]